MSRPAIPRDMVMVVGGPTASGKSALALALAEQLDGEIINADSMQIYRGLPILTAQPDAAALARAPHRLYGALDLMERCSAGRWRGLALAAIGEAQAAGRLPILVGGTGLYLRALMAGLADIPDTPPDLRARVASRLADIGAPAFHAELARRDPEMAARLQPRDRQRLIRAAEVLEHTGRSLADWQRTPSPPPPLRFHAVHVDPPRAALYAACDARFLAMMERGALAEAEAIAARGLAPDLPGCKALGLRELTAHLRGGLALADAVRQAQGATRRYAKRQTTWFSHQFVSDVHLSEQLSENAIRNTIPLIIKLCLTAQF